MNAQTDRNDQLVDDWVSAVRRASADLPAEQRDDLLADLREHVAAARAELRPETEADVRTILDRLGDPATIAAEARLGTPPAEPGRRRGRSGASIVLVAVVVIVALLCAASLYFGMARGTTGDHPVPTAPTPRPSSTG